MPLSESKIDLIQFLKDNNYSAVGSIDTRAYRRAVEHGLKMVGRSRYWYFQRDSVQVITRDPYSTGTVTTPAAGSTTWEFSGTTLPSDLTTGVTTYLEINGEAGWLEITSRTDDDTLETRFAYGGPTAAATGSLAYVIAYPAYDLPANFRRRRYLLDVQSRDRMRWIEHDGMQWEHNDHAGTGQPTDYTIAPKRADPNISQLWFWPAPDTTNRTFELGYWRDAGWWTTNTPATAAWAREAPSSAAGDAYYVDWPEKYMDLLRQACLVSLYREHAQQKYGTAMAAYMEMLEEALEDDEVTGRMGVLSQGEEVTYPRFSTEDDN